MKIRQDRNINDAVIGLGWKPTKGIHLTTERTLLRRPASRCSWMRWQQQQCWRCSCSNCCCWCFLLPPLLAAAWCSLRLRERLNTFCRSNRKLPPRQSVSKKARPSAGPRPRAGFAGDTVADIVIPRPWQFTPLRHPSSRLQEILPGEISVASSSMTISSFQRSSVYHPDFIQNRKS